jgi:hypothetical protein
MGMDMDGSILARALADAASALYQQAYATASLRQVWAWLRGRSRRLLDVATVAASVQIRDQHAMGLQTVPIRLIRGSEGRSRDFDVDFHPLRWHTRERWMRVARASLYGLDLGPVELIQVGGVYFVRDGHHRVSVAAALGQQEIDAIVTVWQVAEPAPCGQPRAGVRAPRLTSNARLPRAG